MKLIKLMKAKLSIDIIIKLIKLNIVKNDCKTNCK